MHCGETCVEATASSLGATRNSATCKARGKRNGARSAATAAALPQSSAPARRAPAIPPWEAWSYPTSTTSCRRFRARTRPMRPRGKPRPFRSLRTWQCRGGNPPATARTRSAQVAMSRAHVESAVRRCAGCDALHGDRIVRRCAGRRALTGTSMRRATRCLRRSCRSHRKTAWRIVRANEAKQAAAEQARVSSSKKQPRRRTRPPRSSCCKRSSRTRSSRRARTST